MKKTTLLNQPISSVIASMGHTDMLVVADAGLPIPNGPERIDLAVTADIPRLVDVLNVVLSELQVERVILAEELVTRSPDMHTALLHWLGETPVEYVPHEQFKQMTAQAKAVVRTGECTPYANVILVAGVVF